MCVCVCVPACTRLRREVRRGGRGGGGESGGVIRSGGQEWGGSGGRVWRGVRRAGWAKNRENVQVHLFKIHCNNTDQEFLFLLYISSLHCRMHKNRQVMAMIKTDTDISNVWILLGLSVMYQHENRPLKQPTIKAIKDITYFSNKNHFSLSCDLQNRSR